MNRFYKDLLGEVATSRISILKKGISKDSTWIGLLCLGINSRKTINPPPKDQGLRVRGYQNEDCKISLTVKGNPCEKTEFRISLW